jgi:hypothetical protein
MTPANAWVHLHLPRLKAGNPEMLSVKVPGSPIFYLAGCVLTDATFKVHERGRQQCIREGVRNVHAWVVGRIIRPNATQYDLTRDLRRAVYDPFKGGTFVDAESLEPLTTSVFVVIVGKDVYYEKGEA